MHAFAALRTAARTAGIEAATRRFLLLFVLPLWLIAGLADWDRHRRTRIEHTAGTRESIIHASQHIHSLLEVVPLMAVSFLTVLHWDQAVALLARRTSQASFALRPKREPLGRSYTAGLLLALMAFIVVPYAEELWRCWRVDHSLAPRPEPPRPATATLDLRVPAEAKPPR